MKKILLTFVVLYTGIALQAQTIQERFVAFLGNKDNNPYSISEPSAFLSSRALERRARYGIAVDEYDLPVTPSYIEQVRATGAEVINTSKWLNTITFSTNDASVLEAVRALTFVDSVNSVFPKGATKKQSGSGIRTVDGIPPYVILPVGSALPSRELKSANVIDYGYAANQINMINLEGLHDSGFLGEGMLIAVLDAGFANANQISVFDSLWQNDQIIGWRDLSEPGNDIFASTMHTHGTSVLSVMGGNIPGQLVGSAPRADYFLIRTEEGNAESLVEEYNWAAGAELADSIGADVINSSLGYTTFDNSLYNHTYSDMDGQTTPVTLAAERAASRGMLVVNSAGNSGGDSWQYIGAPADGEHVFTIGAVDNSGQYALFSSTGPTADGRIKPDVTAQGQGTALAYASGDIGFGSGTSFSSPLMAGAMACLWQSALQYKSEELKDAVRRTASRALVPDSLYGYGIPDMQAARLSIGLPNIVSGSSAVRLLRNPFVQNPVLVISEPVQGVAVFDINGRCVYSDNPGMNSAGGVITLPVLNQLPGGVYLFRVELGNSVVTLKGVKL